VSHEPQVGALLTGWLKAEGRDCVASDQVEGAWKKLEDGRCSLVVVDLLAPQQLGVDFLAQTRERYPDIAVVAITDMDNREKAIKALKAGAYGYFLKPLDQEEVTLGLTRVLERRRLLSSAEDHGKEGAGDQMAVVLQRERETALRLIRASEWRDEVNDGHIRRVGLYSARMAEALGWEQGRVEEIRLAAAMHDIGKVGIADGILLRAERLTAEEFEVAKKHT